MVRYLLRTTPCHDDDSYYADSLDHYVGTRNNPNYIVLIDLVDLVMVRKCDVTSHISRTCTVNGVLTWGQEHVH